MKAASAALKTHLAGELMTLATCWLIKRRDGTFLRFTDHDADLVITAEGVPVNGAYVAAVGYTGSSIASSSDGAVDNLEVAALSDASGVTEADLQGGVYDFAEVKLFLLNWADLSQSIVKLRRGWLGQVSMRAGQFTAEIRGMTQALQQTIGETSSPACRADLGDTRCKVVLAGYTVSGAVTVTSSARTFTDASKAQAQHWFRYGLLTWTSGLNSGRQKEVKSFNAGVFGLTESMPQAIAVGDAYSVYAGCDKRLATCQTKFANVVNFRGEPHLPGFDEMVRTPDAG